MTIAVDFDGTIVENKFPAIGEFLPGALDTLKELKHEGHTLILWTCRSDKYLVEAINLCRNNGLEFDYINENPENLKLGLSEKVYADLYIDDKGWGWDGILSWIAINEQLLGGDFVGSNY